MEQAKSKFPVVLVTGCGSGLGYEIARRLYSQGRHRVVVTARELKSVKRLEAEMPRTGNFRIEKLDITNKSERERLVETVLHDWKSVDVLINNAGVSYRSVIEHMDDESEMHQLDVNYLSPMALIRLVIPSMRENGSGKIINISSVSGMVSIPTMSSYSASKHALEGATEALWYELRPYGISASLVQPGFIRSKSFEKVYFSKKAELSKDLEGPYSEYYLHMGIFVEDLMLRSISTSADIAKKVCDLIDSKSDKLWVPVTADAVIFYWLRKILPRSLFHKFMYALLPKIRLWGLRGRHRAISLAQLGSQNSLQSQRKRTSAESSDVDGQHDYLQSGPL